MVYPHIRPEVQATITAITVKEFEGIDHLPDDVAVLKAPPPAKPIKTGFDAVYAAIVPPGDASGVRSTEMTIPKRPTRSAR